jgi:hypothetical protein
MVDAAAAAAAMKGSYQHNQIIGKYNHNIIIITITDGSTPIIIL